MLKALALLFSLLLSVAAGVAPRPVPVPGPRPQVLAVNLGSLPAGLDPAVMWESDELIVANALYEGLTRLDQRGLAAPAMAESWMSSADGLTWTFRLRDARWSNGDPVTAHDFEFAWKRALDPQLDADYSYLMGVLKNGPAYNEGSLRDPGQVGVRALDARTLQVTLERPAPYLPQLLAFPTFFPVHRATVLGHADWAGRADLAVTNGPFALESWAGQGLALVRHAGYWDARSVQLERIEFSAVPAGEAVARFASGRLDVNLAIPDAEVPRLLASGAAARSPYAGTYYYLLNTRRAPFDDVRVRQALSLAIDRTDFPGIVTVAEPAYAFVPPGFTGPEGDFRAAGGNLISADLEANVARARQLLAEAGYPGGQGFPPLTILYNTSPSHQAVAGAVRAMWQENLGITGIRLETQEWAAFLDTRFQLDYDVARAGWIADYLDPLSMLDIFTTYTGNNDTGWGSADYDSAIATAATSADQVVRFRALHEAEEMLLDQAVVIPLYYYGHLYQEQPGVQGVVRNALDPEEEYRWASVTR